MPASQTEKRVNKRKVAVQVFAKAAPQLDKLGPKAFRAKVKGQLIKKFGLDGENPQHIAQVSTLYNHAKRTNEDNGTIEQFGRARTTRSSAPVRGEGDNWEAVSKESGEVIGYGTSRNKTREAYPGATVRKCAD